MTFLQLNFCTSSCHSLILHEDASDLKFKQACSARKPPCCFFPGKISNNDITSNLTRMNGFLQFELSSLPNPNWALECITQMRLLLRFQLAHEIKSRQAEMTKESDERHLEGPPLSADQYVLADREANIQLIAFILEQLEAEHEFLYVHSCNFNSASFTIFKPMVYNPIYKQVLLRCNARASCNISNKISQGRPLVMPCQKAGHQILHGEGPDACVSILPQSQFSQLTLLSPKT